MSGKGVQSMLYPHFPSTGMVVPAMKSAFFAKHVSIFGFPFYRQLK
jgi:hypothetical protein